MSNLDLYNQVTSTNYIFDNNQDEWRFLLESYLGGEEYKKANHLVRYVNENDYDYAARLKSTPVINYCRSIMDVYISFLFREEPDRSFGTVSSDPSLTDFLDDADLEGRSLNAVMKDVAQWSGVFGHCWMLMSKPNINALTRADEIAQGVRPYLSVLTPLSVIDWTYYRRPSGYYDLSYFKYIEDINDQVMNVVEWYQDRIVMSQVDKEHKKVLSQTEEVNQLGYIPVVIAYNQRSSIRGVGVSDLTDIATQQKAVFNELSEIEQSIRLDVHPSLVTTEDAKIGTGAGSIIYMSNNSDPGLKPYLLSHNSSAVDTIWSSISKREDSIDKMANTGSVRATESRTMSGVAMETEFQLLNARLSSKADSLELAEEQMWKIWADYQATQWDGEVEYPGSFNIRDTSSEFAQLQQAKSAASTVEALSLIDLRIRELLEDPRLENEVEEPEEQAKYQVELAVLENSSIVATQVIPPQPEEIE